MEKRCTYRRAHRYPDKRTDPDMNRATDRVIKRPRHDLIYGHRKVSFRPKRRLHRPLKESQIHRRIDETMENMDIQLSDEFNADERPYTI